MEEKIKHLEAENERLEKEIEHYIESNKVYSKGITRIKEIIEQLEMEDLC